MLLRRRSGRSLALAGAAVLVVGTTLAQGVSADATGASAAAAPSAKVIVVMRDQLSSTPATRRGMPARTARAVQTQNAVLARLSGPRPTALHHFALANAFSAKVTAAQAAALRADPSVARVVNDAAIPASPPGSTLSGAAGSRSRTSARAASTPADEPPFAVCPSDPAHPIIEPEALRTIHAISTTGSPGAQDLTTGVGVKVAYIADGIDPNNPDFIRPDGSHAIIDYQDFSGDGPSAPTGGGEAFGDASAIAAQGTVTYDLSNFVNPNYPLPPGCNITVLGVAPGASIVALKAGGEFLTNSSILQSIDYAVRVDHVDVINESFGLNEFPDDSNRSTVQLFNDAAVAAGVTITESTGDGGVTGTIGSDAQDPKVISAAASTDSQLYAQTGYAGSRFFGNGEWADDEISALSSSGFTQKGRVPDIVAPGEADWAACEASPAFASCTNFNGGRSDIEAFGGTSQSSPLTAGVAALVISAYRSSHNGTSPAARPREAAHHQHGHRPGDAAVRAGLGSHRRSCRRGGRHDLPRLHRGAERRGLQHRHLDRPGHDDGPAGVQPQQVVHRHQRGQQEADRHGRHPWLPHPTTATRRRSPSTRPRCRRSPTRPPGRRGRTRRSPSTSPRAPTGCSRRRRGRAARLSG